MKKINGKWYGTLDEALTAGTGQNAEERKRWRRDMDKLFAKRAKTQPGTLGRKNIDEQIRKLMY